MNVVGVGVDVDVDVDVDVHVVYFIEIPYAARHIPVQLFVCSVESSVI
jgi:hypothetical protein